MKETEVIYEDAHVLVCFKPAGLPVQSANLRGMDLEHALLRHLMQQLEGKGDAGRPYLGLIHRLDQPVQGILAFAKTRQAAGALSAQIRDGQMKKEYLAAVWPEGVKPGEEGFTLLEDTLLKDPKTNTSRVVAAGTKGGKQARLLYLDVTKERGYDTLRQAVAKQCPGAALLRIRLLTGRHHQIRVQLSHANMPILGDRKYAAAIPRSLDLNYPALCACMLSFRHPKTGDPLTFTRRPEEITFS